MGDREDRRALCRRLPGRLLPIHRTRALEGREGEEKEFGQARWLVV